MEMLVTKFSKGKYQNDGKLFAEPISKDSVKLMGEMIALQALRTVKKYDMKIADKLYIGLIKDLHHMGEIDYIVSDGYDCAQTAMCFLYQFLGRTVYEIYGKDKKGKDITIKLACYREVDRLIDNLRNRPDNHKQVEYHFSARRDWRYMGAWERGELGQRLHFHALTYIPEGQMPGELEEHEDYSTKRHRREKSIQNSFFNERFGRSDFSAVNNACEVADSIKYMLKYISKNDEKIVYSRGLKTYFVSDVLDEDILCKTGDEEHGFKYILADNFTCISDGEIMGTVSPEVIEKMPKAN